MRAARNGLAALAVASLLAGCKPDSGFALNLDITPGCAPVDIDQLAITATLKPSGLQAPAASVSAPVFLDGHRHVVILPSSDTNEIVVNVVASKDGAMVAGADLDVPVSGHQVLEMALSLGECVDGGASDAPPPAVLTAIAVTPTDPTLPVGAQLQLVATGTYSDNSVADVTGMVTWSTDKPLITVSGSGMLAGVMPGLAQAKATLGAIQGTDAVLVSAATLSRIDVTPKNGSVGVGSTLQLTATGFYSDNTTANLTGAVTWMAANGDATIAANGLATGVTVGTTTVTASLDNVTGMADLNVTAAMLASITITPANPSLAKGTTLQLTATGNYSDNSSQDITAQVNWSSDMALVATVNKMGQAKAVDVGTANITAKLGKIAGSTPLVVTAPTLMQVVVNPMSTTLADGTTGNFTATGMYSDGSTPDLTTSVTWGSSSVDVATISNANGSQGLATAIAQGDCTISALFMGIMGTAKLSVGAATLQKITITPATVTLHSQTSQQFTAMGSYSDNTNQDLTTQVTWATNNVLVTISNVMGSQGLASVGKAGMAAMVTVTATRGNVTGNATITVDAAQLNSLTISPDGNFKIAAGLTQQYKAVGNFQDGTQDVTADASWSTQDPTVATIGNTTGKKGFLSAVAQGKTVVITSFGGQMVNTNVEVDPHIVVAVTVSPAMTTINRTTNIQFSATLFYSDNQMGPGTKLCTWASSDPTIANFLNAQFNAGNATGLKDGTVTITATNSGKMGTAQLTVIN